MNLPHPAESLCLVHMAAEQAAGGSNEQLFLYIGLTSGVCQRVSFSAVHRVPFDVHVDDDHRVLQVEKDSILGYLTV